MILNYLQESGKNHSPQAFPLCLLRVCANPCAQGAFPAGGSLRVTPELPPPCPSAALSVCTPHPYAAGRGAVETEGSAVSSLGLHKAHTPAPSRGGLLDWAGWRGAPGGSPEGQHRAGWRPGKRRLWEGEAGAPVRSPTEGPFPVEGLSTCSVLLGSQRTALPTTPPPPPPLLFVPPSLESYSGDNADEWEISWG